MEDYFLGEGSPRMMDIEVHGEPVARLDPRVEPLMRRALDLLRADKGAEAEKILKQALEISPDEPSLHNNLARAYLVQGEVERCETMSREIHERFPDYVFGRINLANLLIEKGEIEQAQELIAPLFSRKRFHFAEMSALAGAEISLALARGDQEAAEQWLKVMEQVDSDSADLAAYRMRVKPNVKDLLRTMLRR